MPFLNCRWACMKCSKMGEVRPWGYDNETPMEVARRHAALTRQACIQGCSYAAIPKKELGEAVDGVGVSEMREKLYKGDVSRHARVARRRLRRRTRP